MTFALMRFIINMKVADMRHMEGGEKMTNAEKLKAKLKEKNMSIEDISKAIEIDKSTFYRKLASDGMTFTIGEVDKISKVLNLSVQDINSIFFSNFVA